MVDLLCMKLKEWDSDKEHNPRVAMMSGTGDRAFSAGGDLVSIYNGYIGKAGFDTSTSAKYFADEYLQDYQLAQMRPIQISLWNGITMGGGVGVSCQAPIRVATEKTLFAMPETGIGFFADLGGSYFLSRLNNNVSLGLYLGLTGHRLKAQELLQWGVATHYVPLEKLDILRQDIINNVTQATSIEQLTGIVNSHSDSSAGQEPIPNLKEINSYFTTNGTVHDLYRNLQTSNSNFAQTTLQKLNLMSPLSVGIVFEQIKRG